MSAQPRRVLAGTPVTFALIALNAAVYLWEVLSGTDMDDTRSLIAHGALYAPLVHEGQWWRIWSGAFMHAGLTHIALNMVALFQLGRFVELAMGGPRMLACYVVALLTGGYAVVYFSPADTTVGASGAIFGLFGALLAIGVRLGGRGRGLISQVVPVLLINLALTFAIPFISKAGHLGGLVGGFLAGLVLYATAPQPPAPLVPVVLDTATGESAGDAELLEPERPRA